jgi:hypothetical protein
MNKPNPQQVARAGEHFVAAELHGRGAYAVTFAGNMPEIDILASDLSPSSDRSKRASTFTLACLGSVCSLDWALGPWKIMA